MKKTLLILVWIIAACTPNISPEPTLTTQNAIRTAETNTSVPTAAASPSPSATLTATHTGTPTRTSTRTPSPTITETPTITLTQPPTDTPTLAPTRTPVVLRGTVLQRSNCRYGAGEPYLYKYGLLIGNYLEIIGRNQTGTWIQVRAIGGDNPCWVNARLLDVEGDVMDLAYVENRLPFSPYYGALSGVWADRIGGEVLISWNPMNLREGDDSGQYRYLVEAWVCQGGEIVFLPIGTYETELRVTDEEGCAGESQARVYGVEKHGYTWWTKVPWPGR